MPQASCTVRHARREDVPIILELIRELADYEHELDSVEATIESLSSTIAFAPPSEGIETTTTISTTIKFPPTSSDTPTTTTDPHSISPTRPARCLLLFNEQEQPVGLALYFYNYSTWRARHGIYLEDLYVRESERGKGYGRRLLAELAREVQTSAGGRLEWSVLKWNEPSIRFYEDVIGARKMDEWVGMRVEGEEALRKLAGFAGLD